MRPNVYKEIKKTKHLKNFQKLSVKILWKEKFIKLKDYKKKKLIIWKFFLFDHTGIVELFSQESSNIPVGKKVEVNSVRNFFYRGKIRIFGNLTESKKFSPTTQRLSMKVQKNYSKIIHKKY